MRALALTLTAACATTPKIAPPPELADELLSSTSSAALEITLDLEAYLSGPNDRLDAAIAFESTRADIALDRIGDSSAFLCRWRKLRLRLGEHPKKRLYLTPHCNDADTSAGGALQGEEQLYAQALAYRVLAAVQIPALDARLVSVRWIDRGRPERALARPAILVEDIADVARHLYGDEAAFQGGEQGPLDDLTRFDPIELAKFHLFQILINNRDWRAFHLEPLGRVVIDHRASKLHNVFALGPKSSHSALVPLDLDASSFAALPSSVAEVTGGSDERLLELLASPAFLPDETPLLRWVALRVLGFQAVHGPKASAAAFAHFKARRAELEAAVERAAPAIPDALRPAILARAAQHFDAFYRAIAPPLSSTPVIVDGAAKLYAAHEGDAVVCPELMRGAPVILGERRGDRVSVTLGVKLHIGDGRPRPLCPSAASGWIDARALSP